MFEVFLLLVLFQLKHFISDFPLQTQYMLGKMSRTNWILPLATHAGVHSAGTFVIAFLFTSFSVAIGLSLADFILHFIVDRVKASPDLGGRWKPNQSYFWWALGADQMTHHLINYVFIYIILFYGN